MGVGRGSNRTAVHPDTLYAFEHLSGRRLAVRNASAPTSAGQVSISLALGYGQPPDVIRSQGACNIASKAD